MTTQTQGKGKKKNKELTKLSLDEFNQIDAPHGHSVVNLKVTGLDWAETMADYDQQSAETQQIIVPAAPRSQRGPQVPFDSLPTEPPFRVSIFGVPVSVEEKEITDRFFAGIDIIRVDTQKSSTTLELATREAMFEALGKDGTSMKNRTISVCVYGQQPVNNYGQDRYGGRGSNSSYGDRSYQSGGGGGFGGQRTGDRYGDRSVGFNRDRDNYTGYNRGGGGGFGQQRGAGGGGYGDRYVDNRNNYRDNNRGQYTSGGGEPASEEPENWRSRPTVKPAPAGPISSYNNGSRQPYMQHSRPDSSQQSHHHQIAPSHHHQQQYHQPDPYYQPRHQQQHHHHQQTQHHHNQPPNNSPYNSQFDNQTNNNSNNNNNRQVVTSGASATSATAGAPPQERPKLVINKRKTPLNIDDVSSVTRNEAIFGKAKPTSTPYQKMNEVEEKLKAVQLVDKKDSKPSSQAGSQVGSQPGSAPRSRRVSSNHSESNN